MYDRCDYPAAHSMDTTWFAIDRDGQVAAFDSGEAGAVPTEAYLGDDCFDIVSEVAAGSARSEIVFDLRAGEHVDAHPAAVVLTLADGGTPPRNAVAIATSRGPGWMVPSMSKDVHRALHATGRCTGCAYGPPPLDDEFPDLARHGLYVYDHDRRGNGIAAPYDRVRIPATPASEASLPAAVLAAAARYDGRFADTAALQPVELWPSSAWGPSYLASDGTTEAAIPGQEAAYAEQLAAMAAHDAQAALPRATAKAAPRTPWWRRWFGGGKD